MFSGELAPWHWIIIAILLVVLFGSAKLPGAARSIGRSMRIFKAEVKGLHDDDDTTPAQGAAPTQSAQSQSGQSAAAPTPAAQTWQPAGTPAQPTQGEAAETVRMREEASRLREQAAALERQAALPQSLNAPGDPVRTEPGRNI